ncbi:MAG: hypothetical protein ACNS62_12450 [Candidatus Cyclobacteriaceae bacterium M3_2C_046]
MNLEALNQAIVEIVEKKIKLSQLDYADPRYDQLEESVHELEDQLISDFGPYLEDVLKKVHQKTCPQSQVLLPTAYLANKYQKQEGKEVSYDAEEGEGVIIDCQDHPDKIVRMIMIPSPLRLVLVTSKGREEVWNYQNEA